MKPHATFVAALTRTLWVCGLAFVLTLFCGIRVRSQDVVAGQNQPGLLCSNVPESPLVASISELPSSQDSAEDAIYEATVDGDSASSVATIIEQHSPRNTRYTLHLQLASGAEQSIAVTAPPGGLQLEMLDMTGDNVPNDLIVTPALLRWPLMVLLNDGHDHFTVAISGVFPGSLGSDDGRASAAQHGQEIVALMSSGSKAGGLTNCGGPLLPRLQASLLSLISQTIANRLGYTFLSGRAPPPLET